MVIQGSAIHRQVHIVFKGASHADFVDPFDTCDLSALGCWTSLEAILVIGLSCESVAVKIEDTLLVILIDRKRMTKHKFCFKLVTSCSRNFHGQYFQKPILCMKWCVGHVVLCKLLPVNNDCRALLDHMELAHLLVLRVSSDHLTNSLPITKEKYRLIRELLHFV